MVVVPRDLRLEILSESKYTCNSNNPFRIYGLFQCVWCHKSICPNISSGMWYQKLKVNSLNVGRFIFIFHILNKIKIVMVMHAGVRKSKLDYRN